MNGQLSIENVLLQVPEKELIFASILFQDKLSSCITSEAFYKALGRLCDKGVISKVSKGIYCRPHKTKYGAIMPSDQEIVEAFTKNATGMIVGYNLYNAKKLTSQVPKNYQVYSSGFKAFTKTIGNVSMTYYPLNFSPEVVKTIEILEILNDYYNIQDLNHSELKKLLSEYASVYNDDVCTQILATIKYPKRTIAFLQQVLNYHQRKNSLWQYLSYLSDYKIPKMEEVYGTA